MIKTPEAMWDIWESGDFTGPNRPITRATISKMRVKPAKDEGGSTLPWRTLLFDQDRIFQQYEIPNIQTCNIDRRIGSDAAQMTLTFLNQVPLNITDNLDESYQGTTNSPTRRELGDLGQPGYYTFRRGLATADGVTNPWNHAISEIYSDLFIPNRVVMVYQGYGTDGSADPSQDTKLVRTGIFLLDEVKYSANGTVTLTARDLAKLLIEQRVYPPIIPVDKYPVEFYTDHTKSNTTTTTETVTKSVDIPASLSDDLGKHPTKAECVKYGWDSGNTPWYSYNASVYGHRPSHAFDGSNATWWLSMGNSGPNEVYSYEWIEAHVGGQPINRVRFKPKWGGYKCYIAVHDSGYWRGSNKVPYGYWSGPAYPNDSNVSYVKVINVPNNEEWVEVELPTFSDCKAVRLIFTNLHNSGLGSNPYRAAIYQMEVKLYTPGSSETTQEEVTTTETVDEFIEGNIEDYTDIVKLFAAWGGFYWPYGTRDEILDRWREGTPGRVWGDFFYSGAYPVNPPTIDPTEWDNKSLMDAINTIKEVLGFFFHVDETGGIVWRPPNIWRTGNYITGTGYIGQDSVRVVDEEKVLIQYDATLNDASLRSEIVVVATDEVTDESGDPQRVVYSGSYRPGHAVGEVIASAQGEVLDDVALLAGQERVALVANYPFASQAEVDKFAFLVGLWAHWRYRKSKFRIPGHPGFMPDDQVRIFERITSETYIHYIEGVSSTMDLNSGTWYMDVDTHWLGNGPDKQWLTSYSEMSPALYAYLDAAGLLPEDVEGPAVTVPDYEYPIVPTDEIRVDVDVDALVPDPPPLTWPSYVDGPDVINDPSYSPPSGGTFNCNNEAKFAYWGDTGPTCSRPCSCGCDDSKMQTYTFMLRWPGEQAVPYTHSGQTRTIDIRTDFRAKGAFRLLGQIAAQEGLFVKQGSAYSCRGIANPPSQGGGTSCTTWSNHSWGLAVDINWGDYPFGTQLNQYQPQYYQMKRVIERSANILSVKTRKPVMRNGNLWGNGRADPMHFEICVPPADLAQGVYLADYTDGGPTGGGGIGGWVT